MQDRAIATRQKIIESAARVFASQGYAGATMSEILAGTGVTKGALYFHFTSKEQLALAIFAEDSRFSEVTVPAGGSPLQALIDTSHFFARSLQDDPIAQASVRLAIELTFGGADSPSGFETWATSVAKLLAEARARQELADGVDPDEAAGVLIASFTGVQLVSEATSRRRDLHERVTRWWRLVLPGLAAPGVLADLRPEGTAGCAAITRDADPVP